MVQEETLSLEHQAVRAYGQSEAVAYTWTIATREVVFTCIRCHEEQHKWRYTEPLPKYCPSCKLKVTEEREALAFDVQREKRQAEAANIACVTNEKRTRSCGLRRKSSKSNPLSHCLWSR